MVDIFTIVFIVNIVAIIIMIRRYKKLNIKSNDFYNRSTKYSIDELVSHKNAVRLLTYIGAAGGILLWGGFIGTALSIINDSPRYLLQGFRIGVTISSIPSILGVWKVYKV